MQVLKNRSSMHLTLPSKPKRFQNKQTWTEECTQHHVKTGFRLLTISSRSTITFRRLPSMPVAAA